jgi:general L-amino acid transport system permease protein
LKKDEGAMMTILTQSDTVMPPVQATPLWWRCSYRSIAVQVAVLLCVGAILAFFAWNAMDSAERRNMELGLSFLGREAGFDIGETLIQYDPRQSFAKAMLVGLANTALASLVGLVFATLIGFMIGVGSLVRNRALRTVCTVYVDLFRNVPLLLQLYLWYSIATSLLPAPAEAINVVGIVISKAGIYLPTLHASLNSSSGAIVGTVALAAGIISYILLRRRGWRRSGVFLSLLIFLVAGGTTAFAMGGVTLDHPEWKRFRFVGGTKLSPEFVALTFGLSIYTAGFIAEIVRSGIQAVSKGQREAAEALGLSAVQTLRYILVPQAARVIIPPLTSQYLNLVKNSSLAVAIGYPDLVSIGNTTLNVTGRAIECIGIIMLVYLSVSLAISLAMNAYNKKLALQTR